MSVLDTQIIRNHSYFMLWVFGKLFSSYMQFILTHAMKVAFECHR